MTKSLQQFAEVLTSALYRVRAAESKNLEVIQDELGYALGREGGSFIAHLRRGHAPATVDDLEDLARELVRRRGLERDTCIQFLSYGGYPNPLEIVDDWFQTVDKSKPPVIFPRQLKPFVAGPPITQPRQFFGRNREVRRIFDRWQGWPLEHTAVVGRRRSGKTSLLHFVQRITQASMAELRSGQKRDWLPQADNYRWVWIDFQQPHLRTLAGLLRHLLTGFDLPAPTPCNLDTVTELLIAQGAQRPTVILMDELGAGLSAPELDQSFWWALRSLVNASNSGNLAFLVAAHDLTVRLAEEHGQASPFLPIFNNLKLGPFTEAEARELIASSPTPFDPTAVTWILEQSGRWPLLVQILCQERLLALETGADDWQAAGLGSIEPFRHLLEP